MISKKLLSYLLLMLIILPGCDEKNHWPVIESYPMKPGTMWIYEKEMVLKIFESEESDVVTETRTEKYNIQVWLDKDTILNDTMPVSVFRATDEQENYFSTTYCYLDSEGLHTYAYSGLGSDLIFADAGVNLPILHNDFSGQEKSHKKNMVNKIHVEKSPVLDLKLPLNINSRWTYRPADDSFYMHINKMVTGTENIISEGKYYNCFIVSWEHLRGTEPMGIKITDWIAKEGLVKRLIVYDRVTLNAPDGELNEMNIQSHTKFTLKKFVY